MTTAQKSIPKHWQINNQKFIFNCLAYKLQGGSWIRLQKLFIDNQFDSISTTSITKVKIKGEKGYENTFIVKITFNQKDYLYSMAQELQLQWFIHIINTKIQSNSSNFNQPSNQYINVCSGYIFKKGSFIGGWERCFVMITKNGLTAAKDQKAKIDLQIRQVKQIWTRFQFIEKKGFLVIKFRDFFKYQFAIPIDTISKWTKAIYSLIKFE